MWKKVEEEKVFSNIWAHICLLRKKKLKLLNLKGKKKLFSGI